jgi:hypothetical protein
MWWLIFQCVGCAVERAKAQPAAVDTLWHEPAQTSSAPLPGFLVLRPALPDTVINLDSLEVLIERGHQAERTWRRCMAGVAR